jgi:hypothetical protein
MAYHRVIILDFSARELLLHDTTNGLALPEIVAEECASGTIAPLLEGIRHRLGFEVAMLVSLRRDFIEPGEELVQWHLVQRRTPGGRLPAGGRWVQLTDVPALAFADAEDRALALACASGDAWRSAIADGLEWARPGWLESTRAWAEGALRARSLGRILDCEQVRAWEFSCVLALRSEHDAWFLKCVPPTFEREVRLVRRLAAVAPRRLPQIIEADEARRCLLMARCRGTLLAESEDPAAWSVAVREYARLQLDWIGRTEELLALGCPERSLARLVTDMERLLEDDEALMIDEEDGLTGAEVQALRRRKEELRARCESLAELGIPLTLEHGDLWEANIIVGSEGPVFLDWTDASVAHPFFSLFSLLTSHGFDERLSAIPDARTMLRDAYLAPWCECLHGASLVEAFERAQTPAALHHAVNYHRFILPMVRTEQGARALLPFYLRRLLALTA